MEVKNTSDLNNRKILFVSNSIPKFDCDSGSNRFKEIITFFIENEYSCFLLVNENCQKEVKYIKNFIEIGVKVIYSLQDLNSFEYVWFNGPNSFKKNLTLINLHFPNSKIIYDMVDVHFLRYKRSILLNPFKISDYRRYFKYKKIETKLIQKASIVVAISEKEKELISKYVAPEKVITISNIHYPKVNKSEIPTFNQRDNIVFIGSKHTPNIDAVYFLYNEIMPKVWKINSNIKVQIIGNVAEEIKGISHPMFEFLGYVPNVASYFLNSKLMIAPLRYGAGVKGKIGQAFEYYLPVITTDIGAEGMNLKHNKNALIVNNSDEIAQEILNLYENELLWNTLSSSATDVLEQFSKEEIIKIFN